MLQVVQIVSGAFRWSYHFNGLIARDPDGPTPSNISCLRIVLSLLSASILVASLYWFLGADSGIGPVAVDLTGPDFQNNPEWKACLMFNNQTDPFDYLALSNASNISMSCNNYKGLGLGPRGPFARTAEDCTFNRFVILSTFVMAGVIWGTRFRADSSSLTK